MPLERAVCHSKPRKQRRNTTGRGSEYAEQCALFEWAATVEAQLPELRLLHHTPNGEKRDKVTGARLKRAGVRAGYPDLTLPVARQGHISLAIEMKSEHGRLRPNQEWWLDALEAEGYRCVVCWSWQDAAREICRYLGVTPERFGV
jgi:hypothetical protein